MITAYPLLPARPHGIQLLDDLVAGFAGTVPADKCVIDAVRQALLAERHTVLVIMPPCKSMTIPHPRCLLRACARIRKGVKTVGHHLTERFAVTRIRVHDLWHFQHRLILKILAHTRRRVLQSPTGVRSIRSGWLAGPLNPKMSCTLSIVTKLRPDRERL